MLSEWSVAGREGGERLFEFVFYSEIARVPLECGGGVLGYALHSHIQKRGHHRAALQALHSWSCPAQLTQVIARQCVHRTLAW